MVGVLVVVLRDQMDARKKSCGKAETSSETPLTAGERLLRVCWGLCWSRVSFSCSCQRSRETDKRNKKRKGLGVRTFVVFVDGEGGEWFVGVWRARNGFNARSREKVGEDFSGTGGSHYLPDGA